MIDKWLVIILMFLIAVNASIIVFNVDFMLKSAEKQSYYCRGWEDALVAFIPYNTNSEKISCTCNDTDKEVQCKKDRI